MLLLITPVGSYWLVWMVSAGQTMDVEGCNLRPGWVLDDAGRAVDCHGLSWAVTGSLVATRGAAAVGFHNMQHGSAWHGRHRADHNLSLDLASKCTVGCIDYM